MSDLTATSRATCTLCGCRLRGVLVANVRVRKHNLVSQGVTLSARDDVCLECGFEAASAPDRWRPDAESQARLDAARVKRGWAA